MNTLTTSGVTLDEVMQLAWREAELLDRHDYLPWLKLWAADGTYIIPVERDTEQFEDALNIVFDDARMREARVKRLRSGFSMSSAPPARTVRTVSRFVAHDESDGMLTVAAAQHIAEYKYDRMRVLAADVTYRVRREEGHLRINRKVVRLINSDDALHGIGYLF